MKPRIAIVTAMLLCAPLRAELPVSGRPVPNLSFLDTVMTDFMEDPSRTISAGVLGVSRGGRVIFLHAYGELRPGVNLPETALMRLASVVKPVTAAAVQNLSQAGGFGPTNLQRRVFNLSGNGGVLAISPPGTPDARAQNITIGHLLDHVGGFDSQQPTPGNIPLSRVRTAGIAMNEPDALPTRQQLVDWAMQFPLNFAPGAASYTPPSPPGAPTVTPGPGPTYSNFGYLLLGETLNAIAPGGYLGYVGANILSAQNWIPFDGMGRGHDTSGAKQRARTGLCLHERRPVLECVRLHLAGRSASRAIRRPLPLRNDARAWRPDRLRAGDAPLWKSVQRRLQHAGRRRDAKQHDWLAGPCDGIPERLRCLSHGRPARHEHHLASARF
jgi:hypothetical protein